MATPLLTTKLYIPPPRPDPSTGLTATPATRVLSQWSPATSTRGGTRGGRTSLVPRPRLIERLNAGLHCNLTLISAPAGFGKTTLLSEWIHTVGAHRVGAHRVGAHRDAPLHVAWLSLDEGDNDPAHFLAYFIAAIQTIHQDVGQSVVAASQSSQPLPIQALLTTLINEIAAMPERFTLVLDDYHLITAQPIHDGLTFLLDHLPPQMHLILSSRADPPWPLARLRARREMTELRTNDLRFTSQEAAAFLNEVMRLDLSPEDVAALEDRTEGWIAGLQMDDYFTRGTAAVALGGAYWGMGDASSAEQAFAECASNALKGGYHHRASDGFTITPQADDETLLAGPVADQAALHGLLAKIRDLGLPLLSVKRVEAASLTEE